MARHDLRDHNPNRPLASFLLLELQGRQPAVPLDRWRPLVTADARVRPLQHGPSADPEAKPPRAWEAPSDRSGRADLQLGGHILRPWLSLDDRC